MPVATADRNAFHREPGTSGLSFEIASDGSVIISKGDECIQTAARRAHAQISRILLGGGETDPLVEHGLETLASFLSSTDFAALRAKEPDLAGSVSCRIRIWRDREGIPRWTREQREQPPRDETMSHGGSR